MKKALIISGGGSKGAFTVGVLKSLYFWDPTTDFDIYIGTSTGALIAPMAAMKAFDQLENLYTTQSNENIINKYNFVNRVIDGYGSIFGFGPLKKKLAEIYTDAFFAQLQNSGKEVYLTTVCLQTGELVVFTTAKNPRQGSYYKVRRMENGNQFRAAVLASASQPVFTPAVMVDENTPGSPHPKYQYVDGGVREYLGLMIGVEAGADNILTVTHSYKSPVPDNKEFKTIFEILEQTLDLFLTDVGENDMYVPQLYNTGLNYIQDVKQKMRASGISEDQINQFFDVDSSNPFQNKKPVTIHHIQPPQSLGGGPGGLDFNPVEMKNMMAVGENAFNTYAAHFNTDNFWV